MKIVTIVGARPQFVKAAVVSRAFRGEDRIDEILVHTGQHFDPNMSEVFFEEMQIPRPKYNLDVHSLPQGAMTGRMLEKIEEVLLIEKPNLVLVYGDTNSTLAGALAARKLRILVAHVEAGLRSFNMAMPEEVNRILTDRISDILYCPTSTALRHLETEGFSNFPCRVVQAGDVMEDAAQFYAPIALQKSRLIRELGLEGKKFLLCTLHRAENTDDPARLAALAETLNDLAAKIPLVLPLHPRTRHALQKQGLKTNAIVLDPVGYFDMISLISNCSLVLTDSGGLQKEAYFFRKFCLTLREETEWTELLENGYNLLVGCNKELILLKTEQLLKSDFPQGKDLFGGGRAARRILEDLVSAFQL